MSEDPTRDLSSLDEILQVAFWLQGEGLASSITAAALRPFLLLDLQIIDVLLERLVARGLLRRIETASGAAEYAFTEFAGMSKPGHGECNDPDCECHRSGSAAHCQSS
jgi:hypothetical protein